MSPREFADILELKKQELLSDNKPLKIAAISTTVEMSSRIFFRGEATSGGKIGNYGSYDLYLTDDIIKGIPNVIATREGKRGDSVFKSGKKKGKKHSTTWFDGWKGVREEAERQTAFVDLSMVGDLQSEFTNTPLGSPIAKAEPRRIDVNTYAIEVLSDDNVNKARGNEKNFKKDIFKLSTFEKNEFYRVAEFELKKLFS